MVNHSKKIAAYILIVILVTGVLTFIDVTSKYFLGYDINLITYILIFIMEAILMLIIALRYWMKLREDRKNNKINH